MVFDEVFFIESPRQLAINTNKYFVSLLFIFFGGGLAFIQKYDNFRTKTRTSQKFNGHRDTERFSHLVASAVGACTFSSILHDKISNRCSMEGWFCYKWKLCSIQNLLFHLLQTLNRGQIRPEETQYLVKNLVGGRTYYFRVLANSVKSYESSDEVKFPVPARVKVIKLWR